MCVGMRLPRGSGRKVGERHLIDLRYCPPRQLQATVHDSDASCLLHTFDLDALQNGAYAEVTLLDKFR